MKSACCLKAMILNLTGLAISALPCSLIMALLPLKLQLHWWEIWLFISFTCFVWTIPLRIKLRKAERIRYKHQYERDMRRELDPECVSLVNALNECPGIHTIGSCSGHGIDRFFITFVADTQEAMLPVVWSLNGCGQTMGRLGIEMWRVVATVSGDGETNWWYAIEGPVGKQDEADKIAKRMQQIMRDGVQMHIERSRRYREYRQDHPQAWELEGQAR